MKSKITVDIFGEQYPLVTDSDVEHVQRLAEMVDKNMRDVARKTHCFSGNKISVLAALQIAEEYYRLKNDYDELLSLIKAK